MLRNLLAIPAILLIFLILHALGITNDISLIAIGIVVGIYFIISAIIYARKQKNINDIKVEKKKDDWL